MKVGGGAVEVGGTVAGDGCSPTQRNGDAEAIIGEVISAFQRRLIALDSVLLRDAETFSELSGQARSILRDVLEVPEQEDPLTAEHPGPDPLLSVEAGTNRARRGVHPTQSLQAADELFDVALPIIVRHRGLTGQGLVSVSQRLHKAITRRLTLASLPYVDFLLTKVHSIGQQERYRMSRELHDRVGHGMALAMQRFDLHRFFDGTDAVRAEREFNAGLASLDDVIRTVRQLSTELRKSVGEEGIKTAIESFLRESEVFGVVTSLEITGDAKIIPAPISEELFLIIREACRNATKHGHPSELRVTLTVTEAEVFATVSDNGRGFRVDAPDNCGSGGMPAMAERAELLNGTLEVSSEVGEGTTVAVRAPLTGGEKL
jgi:signal transduction histidine kinase